MRRHVPVLLGLVAAITLLGPPAAANHPKSVRVKDDAFRPDSISTGVYQARDDIVHWTRPATTEGEHNVRQDDLLFRSGSPTDASDFSYKRKFSAGIFPYYCEQHGSPTGGMNGVVRVKPFQSDAAGENFRVHWAANGTNTGRVFDVRFRIDGGPWVFWQIDTDRNFATLRDPEPDREYDFQARSQKSRADTDAVSRWSPKLRVTT